MGEYIIGKYENNKKGVKYNTDKAGYYVFNSDTKEIRKICKSEIVNNSSIIKDIKNARYKNPKTKKSDTIVSKFTALYNGSFALEMVTNDEVALKKKTLVYIDFDKNKYGLVDTTGDIEWRRLKELEDNLSELYNIYNNVVYTKLTSELLVSVYHTIGEKRTIEIKVGTKAKEMKVGAKAKETEAKEMKVGAKEKGTETKVIKVGAKEIQAEQEKEEKTQALEQENKSLKDKISLLDKEQKELRIKVIEQSRTIDRLNKDICNKDKEIEELTSKLKAYEEKENTNQVSIGTLEYYESKIKDMGLYDKMHIPVSMYKKLKPRELETLENGLHVGEYTVIELIKIEAESFLLLASHNWSKGYVIVQMITDQENRKPVDTTMYDFIKIFKRWSNNTRFIHTY